jgi:hypothetical protein
MCGNTFLPDFPLIRKPFRETLAACLRSPERQLGKKSPCGTASAVERGLLPIRANTAGRSIETNEPAFSPLPSS